MLKLEMNKHVRHVKPDIEEIKLCVQVLSARWAWLCPACCLPSYVIVELKAREVHSKGGLLELGVRFIQPYCSGQASLRTG